MVVFLLIMGVILGSAAVNGTMCLFWSGRVCCPMCSGGDDFVPRNRTGVKESLHRRLAKTPASLMWPFLVVAIDPFIKIGLQGLDRSVELLAERDTVELVEDGLVKALDNAIRLWALRLGPRMVNVFHREIKLVVVMLGIAAIFRAAVGQHTAEPHLLFVEERQDAIVQEIGRCDWRLPIIEFGEGDLRVGVDEGLLIPFMLPTQNVSWAPQ